MSAGAADWVRSPTRSRYCSAEPLPARACTPKSRCPRSPRVTVTTELELIQLNLPLTRREVSPLGIDQIVCTALGVHVQGGGARTAKVRLGFTIGTTEADASRTCLLIK